MIRSSVFRPDITEMVDWALRNNYLPTQAVQMGVQSAVTSAWCEDGSLLVTLEVVHLVVASDLGTWVSNLEPSCQ